MDSRSPRFKQVASTAMLLAAAIIWGLCFVAQRSGMEHIGPFLFNGLREVLASAALAIPLTVAWLIGRMRAQRALRQAPHAGLQEGLNRQNSEARNAGEQTVPKAELKYLLLAGLLCGIALYFASNLQQVGLVYVTASKAAFITTLYIVLVPILGLFLRQRTHWNTWVSVGIAVIGLYLLCVSDSFILELGDAVLLIGALFWAVHILAVGHFAPRLTLTQLFILCALQFGVTGVLSLISAPLLDHFFVPVQVTLEAVLYVVPELLYAGILSTSVAFTLAAFGQRYAKPTPAAIIMSTESVFGLLGGVLLLGEVLTTPESIGCVLMLFAVILTQLDFSKGRRGQPETAESG